MPYSCYQYVQVNTEFWFEILGNMQYINFSPVIVSRDSSEIILSPAKPKMN